MECIFKTFPNGGSQAATKTLRLPTGPLKTRTHESHVGRGRCFLASGQCPSPPPRFPQRHQGQRPGRGLLHPPDPCQCLGSVPPTGALFLLARPEAMLRGVRKGCQPWSRRSRRVVLTAGDTGVSGRPAGTINPLTYFRGDPQHCLHSGAGGRAASRSPDKDAAEQGPVLLAAGALFVSTFHASHAAVPRRQRSYNSDAGGRETSPQGTPGQATHRLPQPQFTYLQKGASTAPPSPARENHRDGGCDSSARC